MKISPLKCSAVLLACSVMLVGENILAQTHQMQYSALPPLPTTSEVEQHFSQTTTHVPTPDTSTRRLKYETLFTIEAPPVPPGYDASARIVRPNTDEPAVPAELTATTEPAADQRSELISSSALSVRVESQTDFTPSPNARPERFAELPARLDTQKETSQEAFFVAIQNIGHDGNLEPVLDSPVPDSPMPDSRAAEIDAIEMPESNLSDEIAIDPDSFQQLQADAGDAGNDGAGNSDNEEEEGLDADLDADDLDEQEEDEDEEDLQPEARQFGLWPRKSMWEVNPDIRNFNGQVPEDESGVLIASTQRYYHSAPKTEKVFAWSAPKIRYQPLYFEDVQLERYGQTRGLIKQPFVSGFKFFRDAALLPVNASLDCPGSCDGPLGFCRPGAPCNESGCSSCQR